MNRQVLVLPPKEVHLWFLFPGQIRDAALLSAYERLMSRDERERHCRFYFARDRHQYLLTRALVRTTLSRYLSLDPKALCFTKNPFGRPEVMLPHGFPPIRFNLSHTENLIVCAVALNAEIGVDVENIGRMSAFQDIADRFFSPQEADAVRNAGSNEQPERFCDFWTLKESYIKARGMGLSIPLDRFRFHITPSRGIRVFFDQHFGDNADLWQFWLLKPTKSHKASVSLKSKPITNDPKTRYRLCLRNVVPLIQDIAMNRDGLIQERR